MLEATFSNWRHPAASKWPSGGGHLRAGRGLLCRRRTSAVWTPSPLLAAHRPCWTTAISVLSPVWRATTRIGVGPGGSTSDLGSRPRARPRGSTLVRGLYRQLSDPSELGTSRSSLRNYSRCHGPATRVPQAPSTGCRESLSRHLLSASSEARPSAGIDDQAPSAACQRGLR